MFRPLGSFIPTAVLTDIGLFFDKDQLHQFSLASPRTNGLFKSSRMMDYTKIRISDFKNKQCIELQYSNTDDTSRCIHIDTDEEDLSEKTSIILSTCRSIDEFRWNFYPIDSPNWEYFIINEKLMELMLKTEIRKIDVRHCSIMAPLPLFLKFLYRHGSNLRLEDVKLPCELVSNKTLKLINYADIHPILGSDLVVDVTDELLEGGPNRFTINGFITKFTIKGITAFLKQDVCQGNSFGIVAFNQLEEALNFEMNHRRTRNRIQLSSSNGQKSVWFFVIYTIENKFKKAAFSVNLVTETDQFGMLAIPHNLFGIVAQESFVKFNKIFSNPEGLLPVSRYQMESLSIHHYLGLNIDYTIRGENRKIDIKRTDVNLKDKQKIIVEILRNCTSIEVLILIGIKLDEDFYHQLKPIAHNIDVRTEWSVASALGPKSLREVQAADTGLFGKVKLEFPSRNGSKVIRLIQLFESHIRS